MSQPSTTKNNDLEEKNLNVSESKQNDRISRIKKERTFYLNEDQCVRMQKDQNLVQDLEKVFKEMEATFQFSDGKVTIKGENLDSERVLASLQQNIGIAFTEAEFHRLIEDLTSIEHDRKEMLEKSSKTLTDFLATIQKGTEFTKHNEYGPSRKEWFLIENDRLFWKDKENSLNHTNRSIDMKSIVRIRPGKVTSILKQPRFDKILEDRCFSIIGDRKTIDLEGSTREQRDEWLTYIEFIHRHYVPARRRTMYLEEVDNVLNDTIEDVD